jgi:hypothetical protein
VQQFRWPIRKDSPVSFDTVFKNPMTRMVINLSGYVSVSVEIKRQDGAYEAVEAEFGYQTLGEAFLVGYEFDMAGDWTVQFVATNASGGEVFGEPIRITVAENVRDLDTDELPVL